MQRGLHIEMIPEVELARPLPMQQHLHSMLHGAGRCERTAVHEEDLVGVADGVETVRDDDFRR